MAGVPIPYIYEGRRTLKIRCQKVNQIVCNNSKYFTGGNFEKNQ
jgi:hypothetical protein